MLIFGNQAKMISTLSGFTFENIEKVTNDIFQRSDSPENDMYMVCLNILK